MIGLALLMLFGKRGKHLLLLSGICSSTIMMVLGMSLGFGVLNISYGTVDDIRSPIWIVAPMVQQAPGPILPPVNPINAATATAEIARKRYDKGLANYLDVTDAERTLLQIKRLQTQLAGARYASAINLIKAIGGGWSIDPPTK